MWDGVFSPFVKHRDYQHNSVGEHLAANGKLQVKEQVKVKTNPITNIDFEESKDYYKVEATLHGGKVYTFLIPTEAISTRAAIVAALNEYFENPVEGGRDIEDYLED